MSCEHCWISAKIMGLDYSEVLQLAEKEGWPCTKDDLVGRKLRAGQFWDEETQSDSRKQLSAQIAETKEFSDKTLRCPHCSKYFSLLMARDRIHPTNDPEPK